VADDVLKHGVQAISEVITVPGLINLDFADVKAVMKNAGPAWMSIGVGSGKNRAADAARDALASPLLDVSLDGSRGVLFNVIGGTSLSLMEVNEAARVIKESVDPEANIIFGVAQDPDMDKEIKITLIATGFTSVSSGVASNRDDEMNKFLKGLTNNEEQMDVPSFLRRGLFTKQRQSVANTASIAQREPSPVKSPFNL